MKRKIIPACLLLVILISCEKKVDWQLIEMKKNYIVVDAMVTNEFKQQFIRLSYPVTELNGTPLPISKAEVRVSDAITYWIFYEYPPNSGNYISSVPFAANLSRTYRLHIRFADNTYTAQTTMVPGGPFTELKYSFNTSDSLYYITWVAGMYSPNNPAMWEIQLDWSSVAGYDTLDSNLCRARMVYYSLPTLDISEVFAPQMLDIGFPAGTVIKEKRFSLNEDYIAFLRALLLETNWRGGLFDEAVANIPTNLSDGALGYFSVCAVDSVSQIVSP